MLKLGLVPDPSGAEKSGSGGTGICACNSSAGGWRTFLCVCTQFLELVLKLLDTGHARASAVGLRRSARRICLGKMIKLP
uniref:Uncharacterized protein n=1 Tax=Globodera pallida TaxID=36090 RepID=A0A183CII5_GLOPA